jgi:hypothetical protein
MVMGVSELSQLMLVIITTQATSREVGRAVTRGGEGEEEDTHRAPDVGFGAIKTHPLQHN